MKHQRYGSEMHAIRPNNVTFNSLIDCCIRCH
jgi:pentatricopeptide repeat protein